MFNLEQSITEWRKQMLAAGIQTPVPLEELESHLREEVGAQIKLGLGERQAFEMAVKTIGRSTELKKEFKKASGASVWLERTMIGIAAIFIGFIVFLGGVTMWFCHFSLGDCTTLGAALGSTLIVACRWRYLVPFLPVIPGNPVKRLMITLIVIGVAFAAASFYGDDILPHFVHDPKTPMIFWAAPIVTVFICLGLGLGMDEKEREDRGMTRPKRKRAA
jgi:hypothetical protein